MTDHQRAEAGGKRKEWVKGEGEDWVLLPVEKAQKPVKTPRRVGDMQRAWQIFAEWAFAGDAHGSPVFPKGAPAGIGSGIGDTSADVATAEAAILAFARFEGHKAAQRTRHALSLRHRDGKDLYGADVLNCERVYRLAIKIERGLK